jgi:hypothetical protein
MSASLSSLLVLLIFSAQVARSEGPFDKLATKQDKAPLKSLMHQFLNRLEALRPYMGSPEKFSDPKNKKIILQEITALARLSKKADHNELLKNLNFSFSKGLLQNHLEETKKTFASGNKDYARWMLTSTTTACLACHSQLPDDQRNKWIGGGWSALTTKAVTFEDAQFAFATHRFDEGIEVYRKLVAEFPGNGLKINQLEASIRRIVAYWARIKRDPFAAQKELAILLGQERVPEFIKKDIKAWIDAFKAWQKEPEIDVKKISEVDLSQFADTQMEKAKWEGGVDASDPRMVTHLRLSGILYEYLYFHPKSQITPKILYWLGVAESRLSNSFFFSLGDLYFKECMTSFSTNPIAKKCFEEYEDGLLVSYTGSRGTDIPSGIKKEMNKYKKKVGIK